MDVCQQQYCGVVVECGGQVFVGDDFQVCVGDVGNCVFGDVEVGGEVVGFVEDGVVFGIVVKGGY